MQHHDRHVLIIAATPKQVYDYVTQPWRWHEWHPSSCQATESAEALRAGDEFVEQIALQPIKSLPFRLHRTTHYQVLETVPHTRWKVVGQLKGGTITIEYQFEPHAQGTQFTRSLQVRAHGMGAIWLALMRKKTTQLALVALGNLKRNLERHVKH